MTWFPKSTVLLRRWRLEGVEVVVLVVLVLVEVPFVTSLARPSISEVSRAGEGARDVSMEV